VTFSFQVLRNTHFLVTNVCPLTNFVDVDTKLLGPDVDIKPSPSEDHTKLPGPDINTCEKLQHSSIRIHL